MKCLSCDKALSDFEATRRYAESKEFVDLCNSCLSLCVDFPATIERQDLAHNEEFLEEDG